MEVSDELVTDALQLEGHQLDRGVVVEPRRDGVDGAAELGRQAQLELRRLAHSLKGSCGYVCSPRLQQSALALQLACEELNDGRATDPANMTECYNKVFADLCAQPRA